MGMMAQMLPPIPAGGQPPEMEAPPLAQPPQEAPVGNEVRDRAQTIMRQLMDQRRMNDGLAEQYPPAAMEFRQANEALKSAMLKIMREIQQEPGSNPAPPVGMG